MHLRSSLSGLLSVLTLVCTTSALGAELVLLETSDVHGHVINYDYYKDLRVETFGLSKVYTLIQDARTEYPESILVDNGDLIQGNPFTDYLARIAPPRAGEVHPIYQVMNQIGYQIGNVGNHEFNYGLDFLTSSMKGANYTYINSNVIWADTGENVFLPYTIFKHRLQGEDINIGFIGFTPPQIMTWDKKNLEGKVRALDIVEAAKKYVPEMKAKGADIIVAVPHSGISTAPYTPLAENAVYYLSQMKEIDAILFGHTHLKFPGDPKYDGLENKGIDNKRGTINGKPAVMPASFGAYLGVVKLHLEKINGKWKSFGGHSELKASAPSPSSSKVYDQLKPAHKSALKYIRQPVGTTDIQIHTYFARVMDSASVQLVNDAQIWGLKKELKGTPYEKYPVLSSTAPYRYGRNGPNDYTDVKPGPISIREITGIQLYTNFIKGLLLKGWQIKDYLEWSGRNFNQISPSAQGEIELINPEIRGFEFEIIDGISYQYDLTQPPGKRVVNLTYEGKPVSDDMEFILAVSHFRLHGGGGFPHMKNEFMIADTEIESKEVIKQYIQEIGVVKKQADGNWSILPNLNPEARLVFSASLGAKIVFPGNPFLEILDEDYGEEKIKFRLTLH